MKLLDAKNVSLSRGSRPILRDVSLSLHGGEIVALLGPNGSGKTTLLAALIGQLRGGGTVCWQDKPIEQIDRRERAGLIALLPQSPVIPSDVTVRQYLALGRTARLGWFGLESSNDTSIIATVVADLDLAEFVNAPVASLSGGQRQRALIGRALVQQPRALLLDEPDTFLDLKQQQTLGRLLKELAKNRGIGVLMALHDLNFARQIADRFVLLNEGQSIGEGDMHALNPQMLSAAFDVLVEESPQLTVRP